MYVYLVYISVQNFTFKFQAVTEKIAKLQRPTFYAAPCILSSATQVEPSDHADALCMTGLLCTVSC